MLTPTMVNCFCSSKSSLTITWYSFYFTFGHLFSFVCAMSCMRRCCRLLLFISNSVLHVTEKY